MYRNFQRCDCRAKASLQFQKTKDIEGDRNEDAV